MGDSQSSKTLEMADVYHEFAAAVYAHDEATLRRLTTASFTVINPRQQNYNLEAFLDHLKWLRTVTLDFGKRVKIQDIVAGPDLLIIRYTTRYHERASGKGVVYSGVEWVKFEDCKICEISTYYDWPHGLSERL